MKNSSRLLIANLFALLAVVSILSVINVLGLDLKSTPSITVALLAIPQIGFFYFYWKSYTIATEKVA